jgi:succinate dehydrogenase/fumarate reductase-like Fe-S protein
MHCQSIRKKQICHSWLPPVLDVAHALPHVRTVSAMLFTSAKVSQLSLLPQGEPEKRTRVINMVTQMDKEGFGACTNTGACEAVCPKGISLSNIARMNQEYLAASVVIG